MPLTIRCLTGSLRASIPADARSGRQTFHDHHSHDDPRDARPLRRPGVHADGAGQLPRRARPDVYETRRSTGRALDLVRYLDAARGATMEHLRNLLVTATHKDARVTAFLVTWAFEKFWIADALDQCSWPTVCTAPADRRRGRRRARPPTRRSSAADPSAGPSPPSGSVLRSSAIHMTTGLIDEWVLRAAYDRMRETPARPTLRDDDRQDPEHQEPPRGVLRRRGRRGCATPRSRQADARASRTAAWPIGGVDRAAADRDLFERIRLRRSRRTRSVPTTIGRSVGLRPSRPGLRRSATPVAREAELVSTPRRATRLADRDSTATSATRTSSSRAAPGFVGQAILERLLSSTIPSTTDLAAHPHQGQHHGRRPPAHAAAQARVRVVARARRRRRGRARHRRAAARDRGRSRQPSPRCPTISTS